MWKNITPAFLFYILLLCTTTTASSRADISDAVKEIANTLSNLTCETKGAASYVNLFREDTSNSCIKSSIFSFSMATIVSPLFYPSAILNTILEYDNDKYPDLKYNCNIDNRADPWKPVLSFGICSDVILIAKRTISAATLLPKIGIALISDPTHLFNEGVVNILKKTWDVDPYKKYIKKEPGDSGISPSTIPFPWTVIQYKDQICLATVSLTGNLPIGCKFTKEPYPVSYFNLFFGHNSGYPNNSANKFLKTTSCTKTKESCYQIARKESQSLLTMSMPVVECVKSMLNVLLVNPESCNIEVPSSDSTFFSFQQAMRKTVSALLTLYVIFVGFNILLKGDIPNKKELVIYVLKFVLVTYFSIGINSNNDGQSHNGITEWLFPLMMGATSEFANWIMDVNTNGLCYFKTSDYTNPSYAIWDSLDCRIAHYLGLDALNDFINQENNLRASNFLNNSVNTTKDIYNTRTNFSIPPYLYLIIPAIITGSVELVSLALAYPLLVISVGAFMLNGFVISMILITILSIMAPIFVPMALFSFTKPFFENWLRLIISLTLQPMIVAIFMIVLFSIYEAGFYSGCQYYEKDVKLNLTPQAIKDINNPVVTLLDPKKDSSKQQEYKKVFYIELDKDKYRNPQDYGKCISSLGYMLSQPSSAIIKNILNMESTKSNSTQSKDSNTPKAQVRGVSRTSDYEGQFTFISDGLAKHSGPFGKIIKVIYQSIKHLLENLLTSCLLLYVMYNISKQLSQLVSDISMGPNTSKMGLKATDIFNAGMQAIGMAAAAASSAVAKQNGADGASGKTMDTLPRPSPTGKTNLQNEVINYESNKPHSTESHNKTSEDLPLKEPSFNGLDISTNKEPFAFDKSTEHTDIITNFLNHHDIEAKSTNITDKKREAEEGKFSIAVTTAEFGRYIKLFDKKPSGPVTPVFEHTVKKLLEDEYIPKETKNDFVQTMRKTLVNAEAQSKFEEIVSSCKS